MQQHVDGRTPAHDVGLGEALEDRASKLSSAARGEHHKRGGVGDARGRTAHRSCWQAQRDRLGRDDVVLGHLRHRDHDVAGVEIPHCRRRELGPNGLHPAGRRVLLTSQSVEELHARPMGIELTTQGLHEGV